MHRHLLAVLALALLVPATAHAATPKTGTYSAQPLSSGVPATAMSVTVDKGRITALSFTWSCDGSDTVDRKTSVVLDAAGSLGQPVIPVKRGRFSVSRSAHTLVGAPGAPIGERRESKAKVKVSGKWIGSKAKGTFSASMAGCSSGPLTWAATRA